VLVIDLVLPHDFTAPPAPTITHHLPFLWPYDSRVWLGWTQAEAETRSATLTLE